MDLMRLCVQERLRVIWNKYYSESHGVVFVVDSANEARFQEAKETLRACRWSRCWEMLRVY